MSLPLPLPHGEGLMPLIAAAIGASTMVWYLYKMPHDQHNKVLAERLKAEEEAHNITRTKLAEAYKENFDLRAKHD